jgi:hypothetical protein
MIDSKPNKADQTERAKRLKWARQLKTISEGIVYDVVSQECDEERAVLLVQAQHALSVAMEALWKIEECFNIVDCKKTATKAVAEVRRICSEGTLDPAP